MVLISCWKKWHNDESISIKTYLKTKHSIHDGFNFAGK